MHTENYDQNSSLETVTAYIHTGTQDMYLSLSLSLSLSVLRPFFQVNLG